VECKDATDWIENCTAMESHGLDRHDITSNISLNHSCLIQIFHDHTVYPHKVISIYNSTISTYTIRKVA